MCRPVRLWLIVTWPYVRRIAFAAAGLFIYVGLCLSTTCTYMYVVRRTPPLPGLQLASPYSVARLYYNFYLRLISLVPRVGLGHHSSPLSIYFLIFPPFLLFSFFYWLYLFSSFVHPFPFYQNSPTPFPGRRSWEATEPGFSLFCSLICGICIPYLRYGLWCFVLFCLV